MNLLCFRLHCHDVESFHLQHHVWGVHMTQLMWIKMRYYCSWCMLSEDIAPKIGLQTFLLSQLVVLRGSQQEHHLLIVAVCHQSDIQFCYWLDIKADRLNACKVCCIAPLLLFKRNLAVCQVLSAGMQQCQSRSTIFYLRECHLHIIGQSSGPVVVAQCVV